MTRQILLIALAISAIVVGSIIPNLARATTMTDMFCVAYRMGVAQSPQQSAMCGLLGSGQLLSQAQQNQGINQNPCINGYVLSGVLCVPINGAATAAQQQTVVTPTTQILAQPIANAVVEV